MDLDLPGTTPFGGGHQFMNLRGTSGDSSKNLSILFQHCQPFSQGQEKMTFLSKISNSAGDSVVSMLFHSTV